MVETKPAGLSPTFCVCSLGSVKETHEQMFQKPAELPGNLKDKLKQFGY